MSYQILRFVTFLSLSFTLSIADAEQLFGPSKLSQRKGAANGSLSNLIKKDGVLLAIDGDRKGRVKSYFDFRIKTEAKSGYLEMVVLVKERNTFTLTIEENGRDKVFQEFSQIPPNGMKHLKIPLENLDLYLDRKGKTRVKILGDQGGVGIVLDQLAIRTLEKPPVEEPSPPPPPQEEKPEPTLEVPESSSLSIDYPLEGSNVQEDVFLAGKCVGSNEVSVFDKNSKVAELTCSQGRFSSLVPLGSGPISREVVVKQVIQGQGHFSRVEIKVLGQCQLNAPSSVSQPVVRLNAGDMPEKTWDGQREYDNSWMFYFNSSNSQYIDVPETGYYTFSAQARSTYLGSGSYPRMQISLNGRVLSETEVKTPSLSWYHSHNGSVVEVFKIPRGRHKISVGFSGWSKKLGQQHYQNLMVGDVIMYPTTASCIEPVQIPVANHEVPLREIASARGLRFGAVLDTGIAPTGTYYNPFERDSKNREFLKNEFNHVVPGSSFLMDRIAVAEGVYDFREADAVVDFALKNGQSVTWGHLVWHHFVPDWLRNKNPSRAEVENFLRDYISKVMNRYRGKIKYWIVVNEAFSDSDGYRNDSFWYQKMGADYIEFAFRVANSINPDAVLIYNDYDMDEIGRKADFGFDVLKQLKSRGVPIDAVGLQGHLKINQPLALNSLIENMERFASLGLEVHLSEVDVALPRPIKAEDFDIQAQFYRNTLKACLQVKACKVYAIFGTIDKYWWYQMNGYSHGAILNDDYSPKPAFKAIQGLMRGQDPH